MELVSSGSSVASPDSVSQVTTAFPLESQFASLLSCSAKVGGSPVPVTTGLPTAQDLDEVVREVFELRAHP